LENKIENETMNFLFKENKKNLLISSFYQLFIPIILIGLPAIVIFVLRIDLLPPFTVGNAPILWTIGSILILLIIVQIILAIKLKQLYLNHTKILKVIGYIIGIAMIINPPVGTYYGSNFLIFLRNLLKIQSRKEVDNNKIQPVESSKDYIKMLGSSMFLNGIYQLYQPILIFLFNMFLLALPLDMAHPIITSDLYDKIDTVSTLILLIYISQILFGLIIFSNYIKFQYRIIKIFTYLFSIFNIIAISIVLGLFLLYLSHTLELSNYSVAFFAGGFILGLILNPLGISFGKNFMKILKYINLN